MDAGCVYEKQMPRGGVYLGSELHGQISIIHIGSHNAVSNFGSSMVVVGFQTARAKVHCSNRQSAYFLHRRKHTRTDMIHWEQCVLHTLKWDLSPVTPLNFLDLLSIIILGVSKKIIDFPLNAQSYKI